jgi:hypothetical protein
VTPFQGTTMWTETFFIDLPMFASNHHFGALGRKKTGRQVMILCLKEVKSIPIQVQFGSLQCDTLSLADEGIF